MSSISFERLRAPFAAEDIEWRVGQSGRGAKGYWAKVLAYLTNRAIMERLDEVCGPENWWNEFRPAPHDPSGKSVLCGITILIDGRPVTKWDGAESTDVESTKGGLSDAMKRAAVQWGIGRYLYNLGESWAECSESKPQGSGAEWHYAKTKEGTAFYWRAPGLPHWALPPQERRRAQIDDQPVDDQPVDVQPVDVQPVDDQPVPVEERASRTTGPKNRLARHEPKRERTPHEAANVATGNRLKRGSDLPQSSRKSETRNLAGATHPVKQPQRGGEDWRQWLTPPEAVAEHPEWYIQAWKGLRAHGGATRKPQVEALLWMFGIDATPEEVLADHQLSRLAWQKLIEARAAGREITDLVGDAIRQYLGEPVENGKAAV